MFWAASIAATLLVFLAARRRSPLYARFVAILLGIQTLISGALAPHTGPLFPAYCALQAAFFVHFLLLSWPRMRPLAYRLLVSMPASYFAASTFLAFPWAIAAAFGLRPAGVWIPYAIALLGIFQSTGSRREEVDVIVDGADAGPLKRHSLAKPRDGRPLRVVQITDPHLGPFMSVARLRRICERAVAQDPDLVLLTGDFLTMESPETEAHLASALAPLARAPRGATSRATATTITSRRSSWRAPSRARGRGSWWTTRPWWRPARGPCRSWGWTSTSTAAPSGWPRCARATRGCRARCASCCCTTPAPSSSCRRVRATSCCQATRTAASSAS